MALVAMTFEDVPETGQVMIELDLGEGDAPLSPAEATAKLIYELADTIIRSLGDEDSEVEL